MAFAAPLHEAAPVKERESRRRLHMCQSCGPSTEADEDGVCRIVAMPVCAPTEYYNEALAACVARCGEGTIPSDAGPCVFDYAFTCGPGTYYNATNNGCFACSEGSYQDERGQSSCKECTEGNFCPGPSTAIPPNPGALPIPCVTSCDTGEYLVAETCTPTTDSMCVPDGMVAVLSFPYTNATSLRSTDLWTHWTTPAGYGCGDMNTDLAQVYFIPASATERKYSVSTCGGDLDTELIVYRADDPTNPTFVVCDDDGATDDVCRGTGTADGNSDLAFIAEARVGYYIAVRYYDPDDTTGAYTLNINAHPAFAPITVDLSSGSYNISTTLDLTDVFTKWSKPATFTCGDMNTDHADVYHIPAGDTDRLITVNTCGSDLDTELTFL
ncbi:hypothetical protein FOA52_002243 [Chlamydomonas sp. UWO 241]|nr:hypothetical protein FOA52_002243 [Chlamydomonas sp. UWO 241]